jgi:hypothetical protein
MATQKQPAEWVERYGKRVEASRLPESKEKQEAYVSQVGLDGQLLLQAVYESNAPEWLSCSGPTDPLHLPGAKKLYFGKKQLFSACSLSMQAMPRTAPKQG